MNKRQIGKTLVSLGIVSSFMLTSGSALQTYDKEVRSMSNLLETTNEIHIDGEETPIQPDELPNEQTVLISAVGDCTLGTDIKYGYEGSFNQMIDNGVDPSYFFSNVYSILSMDDYTIANLECVLTNHTNPKEKKFTFRGNPSNTQVLIDGSVECVNMANNHSHDFYDEGYSDTINALDEAGIDHFGYENISIREVNGVKIANAGFTSYYAGNATDQDIQNALDKMDELGADIKIITIHGGIERDYQYDSIKEELAHYAIDHGADLVLGHHPHVLQGIEEYNGKYIVYSLGNFCYGGHRNPADKDTMIFQIKFTLKDGEIIAQEPYIIPVSLSSVTNTNDYCPKPLDGEEKDRVLDKILKLSKNFNYEA